MAGEQQGMHPAAVGERGRDSGATIDKKRKRKKNVTSHYLISMEFMEISLIKLRIPVA